jgi:hypothetical protein
LSGRGRGALVATWRPVSKLRNFLGILAACGLLACAGVDLGQDDDPTVSFGDHRRFDWFRGGREDPRPDP